MVKYYLRLAFWCLFWVIAWPIAAMFRKPNEQNCLTWALKQLEEKEGYLVIRWARSAKHPALVWPHFMFLDAKDHEKLQHLVPDPNKPRRKTVIPDIWFEGQPRTGDPEESDKFEE